jgi:hypothetical protein
VAGRLSTRSSTATAGSRDKEFALAALGGAALRPRVRRTGRSDPSIVLDAFFTADHETAGCREGLYTATTQPSNEPR